MSMLSPFLSIDASCDQTLQAIKTMLSQAGLSAIQTFNLTIARRGLHNCRCPKHGIEGCDCQMIILLVYGDAPDPATLILHGSDGRTWISIADNSFQQVDPELIASIRHVLADLGSAK